MARTMSKNLPWKLKTETNQQIILNDLFKNFYTHIHGCTISYNNFSWESKPNTTNEWNMDLCKHSSHFLLCSYNCTGIVLGKRPTSNVHAFGVKFGSLCFSKCKEGTPLSSRQFGRFFFLRPFFQPSDNAFQLLIFISQLVFRIGQMIEIDLLGFLFSK